MVSRGRLSPRTLRRGLATMEAVMATAVGFPAAVLLFWLGVRGCKYLFHAIGTLVGWPYL